MEVIIVIDAKERIRQQKAKWYMDKYNNDSEFKEKKQKYLKDYMRNKYQNNEEYRKKQLEYKKLKYAEKKALKATINV